MPKDFQAHKRPDGGLSLAVRPGIESEVKNEIAFAERNGLSTQVGLLVLQDRLAALEQLVLPPSTDAERAKAGRKRQTRRDRVPFGWRVDPRDSNRLIQDAIEQKTILIAIGERRRGKSWRATCAALDQAGRTRRGGKPWTGAHGTLRAILRREGREPTGKHPG